MSLPDPITRREQYLNIAAGGTGSLPPRPITREEQYLAAIAEGGSGGGSALPSVTAADNGKILLVEDGAWVVDENDFVVTFNKSGSTWTTDASFDAIEAAFTAGKNIYGQTAGANVTTDTSVRSFTLILPLSGFSSTYGFVFGGSYQSQTNTIFATIIRQRLVVQGFTKTIVVGSYSKPSGGIPESDLSADVQERLNSNLPDPEGSTDKILMTDAYSGNATWADKQSVYPSFSASDEGKALKVNSSGDVVWGNKYVENLTLLSGSNDIIIDKSDGTAETIQIPPALRIVNVSSEDRAAMAQILSPILAAAANSLNTPQAFSVANPAMAIRLLQITNNAAMNGQPVALPAAINSQGLLVVFISTALKSTGLFVANVTFTAQFDYKNLRYDVSMLVTEDGVVEIIATATSPSYTAIPTGMHTISEVVAEIRDSVNAMSFNDLYSHMQASSGFAIPFNDASFDSEDVEFLAYNVSESNFQILWDDVNYQVEVTFDTANETFTIDRVFCTAFD